MSEAAAPSVPGFSSSALGQAAAATVAQMAGNGTPAAPAAPTPPAQQTPKSEAPAPKLDAKTAKPSAWDKVPEVKAEEVEATVDSTQKPAETEVQGDATPKESRWKELRAIEAEHKVLKPELEHLRAKLQEYETKPPVPEDVSKELEDHRKWRAGFDLQNQPHFIESVVTPWNEKMEYFQQVSEFSGIALDKILAATQETNPLKRAKDVAAVLAESTEDVSAILPEVNIAAKALHDIGAKEKQLKAKALEIQTSLKGEKEKMTAAETQKSEAEYSNAYKEVASSIGPKFAEIFKNDPELRKEFDAAPKPETVMDRAYHAQAAVLLPAITKQFLEMRAELQALKKAEKARIAARPSMDGQSPAQQQDSGPKLTLMGAAAQTLKGVG